MANPADTARSLTLIGGIPATALVPIPLWFLLPFKSNTTLAMAVVVAIAIWWLHTKGWTIKSALRRLRRLAIGPVVSSLPWWRRRGW